MTDDALAPWRLLSAAVDEAKAGLSGWPPPGSTSRWSTTPCVAIMERFVADHPDLWYEDIGIAPGHQT